MIGGLDGVDGRDAGDGHDRVAGNPADAHEVTAPDGRAITRRQLLVGASVAGLSGVAAGALLGHYATGGSGGGDEGAGRSVPAGGASGPQLGVVMPGDPRPDAPELAHRGPFGVGVRGWTVTNPDQIDVVHYLAGSPVPRYDRPLPLMVWYPAVIPAHTAELTTYSDVLGSGNDPMRPNLPFEFAGRALRGAAPAAAAAAAMPAPAQMSTP